MPHNNESFQDYEFENRQTLYYDFGEHYFTEDQVMNFIKDAFNSS